MALKSPRHFPTLLNTQMMDEEENYDTMRQRLEAANEDALADFTNYTIGEKKKGKWKMHQIAEKMRFFANEYLLDYEETLLLEGLSSFHEFVGDWFIRNCMWTDDAAVRENLTAYDTFVAYLRETNRLPEGQSEDYTITKEDRHLFQLRAKAYGDPETDFEGLFDDSGRWNDDAILARVAPG